MVVARSGGRPFRSNDLSVLIAGALYPLQGFGLQAFLLLFMRVQSSRWCFWARLYLPQSGTGGDFGRHKGPMFFVFGALFDPLFHQRQTSCMALSGFRFDFTLGIISFESLVVILR